MKKIMKLILILTIGFINQNIFSQNIKVGDVIILNNTVPVTKDVVTLYAEDKDDTKKLNFLEANVKFKVLEITETTVNLIALNFEVVSVSDRDKEKKDYPNKKYKSDFYNNKSYTISKNNFNSFAEKVEPKELYSIGLLTLPFKARPQNDFSFDTEFNLSSTLNIRLFDIGDSSFNYQVGAGIGSVGLNTSNANGLNEDEAQDVATLTLLNGLMIQYKKVQVGIYAGVDQINNQKNYNWESNGKIWFGFGISYNLFDFSISNVKNKQY